MSEPDKPPLFSKAELKAVAAPILASRRAVRFQDVDAAGTIFFPRVFEYFADAYGELLAAAGLDVPAAIRRGELAAPLAHAEADYLAPLFYGDEVEVAIVAARAGRSSVTLGHRMTKLGTKERTVASIGITVHVFVDPKTFAPAAVPEPLRRYLSGP